MVATGEYDRSLVVPEQEIHNGFPVKSVGRAGDEVRVNREHHRLCWWGKVLLVEEKGDL